MQENLNIAVCIATSGRPKTLRAAVINAVTQTRLPDLLFICPASPDDFYLREMGNIPVRCEIITIDAGLTKQRNAMLKAAEKSDIILFIDDDFLLAPDYVSEMEALFQNESRCAVATGY